MIEDIYFQDEGKVKILAASVGISKKRWIAITEDEDDGGKHREKMSEYRIDHLPIIPNNGVITEFYKTKTPDNFTEIEKELISHEDVLPIDTTIDTVIDKFCKEKKSFYFLSFNKEISGLITIGNLNCKQVQVYVFSLVCELERELAIFLNFHLNNDEILKWLNEKSEGSEEKRNKYSQILNTYNTLAEQGLENMLTEHLFLVDFFNIIKSHGLHNELLLSKQIWKSFSSINELRNKIAHPTRSLLDNSNTINDLGKRLLKINDLLFRLNTFKKTNNL